MNQNFQRLDKKEESGKGIDEPFTMAEMVRAINRAKQTSPGKDQICYGMLKHLGERSLLKLLEIYNKVWKEGKLPSEWKEAVVIPIRKPGKDPTNPINYRPIALTSNLCKIMERMITERLSYELESRGVLNSCQSGFRKGRSTLDSVLRLENEIRKAQANKESVVAVFFDIEKAYDMMWKEGLLIKLSKLGVEGRVFNWIKDFLFERKIQVKIGVEMSSQYTIENGTPQGSVISPLLFIIMINDVFVQGQEEIGRSLFADDGAVWKRGRNVEYVIRKVQGEIDKVAEWGFDWGFRFSIDKTKTVFFTRKRIQEDKKLRLYGREIERLSSFKFLGVTLDSRLTFAEHIRKVEGKCKKVVNVMRCLTGKEWGASCSSLKSIYVALIRSVLDYGSIVVGAAAKSLIKRLEVVQTQALRVCCGAFKTSSAPALQVEVGEMPLELRRVHLMANYWVSLKGHNDNHPTKALLKECWENGRNVRENFGRIGNKIAEDLDIINVRLTPTVVFPALAPWKMIWPEVDWFVLEEKRKAREEINVVSVFKNRVGEEYGNFIQIYTDGAKNPETEVTGFGVAIPGQQIGISRRTSDKLGVYTVEMLAVLEALRWLEKMGQVKALICSDSSSVLGSLRSFISKSRQDILYEVLQLSTNLVSKGSQVKFMWVPAHVGIRGNEMADKLAKRALLKDTVELQISLSKTEVKSIVWEKINKMWQVRWDREERGRQLYRIQNSVKGNRLAGGNRREEIVITRLRLGHCLLNKTLKLMGKHQTGLCEECQVEESVEHVLIECQRYLEQRGKMSIDLREMGVQELTLKSLLGGNGRAQFRVLMTFLKETGLYSRI